MFQNIAGELEDKRIVSNKIKMILKELFKFQNIIIYLLTILISTISIKKDIMPFGLIMIAATLGTGTPIIGVFISATIGTIIGSGLKTFLKFLSASILYFIFVLVFKSQVAVEERNEVIKTGGKLFWANLIIEIVSRIKGNILFYDLFTSIISSAIIYVFYKIFVNGLVVIKNIKIKKAFSIEELIGASIILSICSFVLNKINIYGLNISNTVIMFLIMLLGWKNGMLLGGTAGISIGLAISITGQVSILQITIYAASGIISGLLNKFGKVGVILGFLLGNSFITYITNGNTFSIIYLREMIISSICLLLVPNKFKIDVEDLFGKVKLLDNLGERRLEDSKNVIEKLKTLSKTIEDISENTIETVPEDFTEELLDELEQIPDNIFYDEIIDEKSGIIKDIGSEILKKEILVEKDLIKILNDHNNYVYIQDENIKNDIQEVIKIINRAYKIYQIEKIKIEEKNKEKKNIKKELKNISNAINNCVDDINSENSEFSNKEKEINLLLKAKKLNVLKCEISKIKNGKFIIKIKSNIDTNIYNRDTIINIGDIISKSLGSKVIFQKEEKNEEIDEYVQTYASEDKFVLQVGSSKITKENSEASGDCNLQMKLEDGKYILAISDGKGSGRKARESSKKIIKNIKELFSAGFEKKEAINLINSTLNTYNSDDMFASLDISILDLFLGKIEVIKNGCPSTYIKNKKNIKIIKSENLPIGITDNVEYNIEEFDLNDGDIVLMFSDGLLDLKNDIGEEWIEQFLKNISTNNVQKMADLILSETIDNSYGIAEDDITVIVAKVLKKK